MEPSQEQIQKQAPIRKPAVPRRIQIDACLNGYIVVVGCQILIFRTASELASELLRYLENPPAIEIEYQNCARYLLSPMALAQEQVGRPIVADPDIVGSNRPH